jgi:hypothetical protein
VASKKTYSTLRPMRIQARPGSQAERLYYEHSALPGGAWPMPKAIAPGILPSVMDDLMFHGGKVVPQMEYQNIFLGSNADWLASDIASIDISIRRAMQDRRLNNVMVQYFPGAKLSCDPRTSFVTGGPKPATLDQTALKNLVIGFFDGNRIAKRDLATTIFNLILPPGTVLKLDGSSSLNGLGGFHDSVHFTRSGRKFTLYYSANVFSQVLPNNRENGIAVFDRPWKNVVGTLYHEINEFRTDPDVGDAILHNDNDFLGWTSRRGHEVGDQPIFVAQSLEQVFKQVTVAGTSKRVPVQFLFSNAVHGAEGPINAPH